MEKMVPAWLDATFLKTAILNGKMNSSEIEILNYQVKPAVNDGENYCSTMYRVRVDYYERRTRSAASTSLIVKAPVAEDAIFKDVVEEGNLTKNEYIFYKQILPSLKGILQFDFVPKTYACQVEDVLVMEDLKEDDYVMCDSRAQLDYDHCEAFLSTLAKFHAMTVALHEKDPELIERNGNEALFTNNIVNSCRHVHKNEVKIIKFAKMAQELENMEPLATVILDNHKKLGSMVIDIFNKNDNTGLKVLNHGDCWVNNILFKHDRSGKVESCKLVDFQLRRYASPATDLMYFLISSPQPEVREHHMETLLQVYQKTLNRNLSELGCQARLSAQQLEDDMRRMTPVAMFIASVLLPVMVREPSKDSSDDSEEPCLQWFTGNAFKKILPHVCKQLVVFGVLDHFNTSL